MIRERLQKFFIPQTLSFDGVLDIYASIADFLDAGADPISLRRSIAILDLPLLDLTQLGIKPNPLSVTEQKKSSSVTLASLLVIGFPEVRWFFCGRNKTVFSTNTVRALQHHSLSSGEMHKMLMRKSNADQLFDSSGLRNYIRACINEDVDTKTSMQKLPLRDDLSAAIDDEEAYAFLHAYLAYKLGNRCHL